MPGQASNQLLACFPLRIIARTVSFRRATEVFMVLSRSIRADCCFDKMVFNVEFSCTCASCPVTNVKLYELLTL